MGIESWQEMGLVADVIDLGKDRIDPVSAILNALVFPRSVAMNMVGHKTRSIYQRYAIADESMLKDAVEKLERLHSVDGETGNGRVTATS